MKHEPNLLLRRVVLAVVLLAVTTAALAANTAKISVIGTIMPEACSVSVDNNGTFDYGSMAANTLSPTQANFLGIKTHNLEITCESPTKIAITSTDNIAASVDGSDGVETAAHATNRQFLFGLGYAPDGMTKLGAYGLVLKREGMIVNGSANAVFLETSNEGLSWKAKSGDQELYDEGSWAHWETSWGAAEQGTPTPMDVKNVTVPVQVTAAIQQLNKLPNDQKLELSGDATFTLIYL